MNALLRTGEDEDVSLEVATQLSATKVRCIALALTRGLARGAVVTDAGETLREPVGERSREAEELAGLEEGERVVLHPLDRVRDGAHVEAREAS